MIGFLKRKARLLLLEDDASMQRLVTTLLKRDGYRVDVFGKGNDAIAALDRESYDALLLDLMMPHEGGMTVIRHLRDNKPELLRRIILLTATTGSVIANLQDEVGAVVRKPFEAAELVATVGRVAR